MIKWRPIERRYDCREWLPDPATAWRLNMHRASGGHRPPGEGGGNGAGPCFTLADGAAVWHDALTMCIWQAHGRVYSPQGQRLTCTMTWSMKARSGADDPRGTANLLWDNQNFSGAGGRLPVCAQFPADDRNRQYGGWRSLRMASATIAEGEVAGN